MKNKNWKRTEYKNNQEPKVGDKVRSGRDMEDGVDELFIVETVGLGRLGNKVFIRPSNASNKGFVHGQELYYYCLCPQ